MFPRGFLCVIIRDSPGSYYKADGKRLVFVTVHLFYMGSLGKRCKWIISHLSARF